MGNSSCAGSIWIALLLYCAQHLEKKKIKLPSGLLPASSSPPTKTLRSSNNIPKWIAREFCGLDFKLYFCCDLGSIIIWCQFELQMLTEMHWSSSVLDSTCWFLSPLVSSKAFFFNGHKLCFLQKHIWSAWPCVFVFGLGNSLHPFWCCSRCAGRWQQYCLSCSVLLA